MATEPTKPEETKKVNKKATVAQVKVEGFDSISTLFQKLASPTTPEASTEKPISGLEKEVSAIFTQASDHRDKLVRFFIVYTSVFSGFVALIIIGQALVRTFFPGKETIELVPYWALNLLVIGLIGQFISLLTIVTKKVWQLTDFFNYAKSRYNQKQKDQKKSETEER